MKPRALFRVVKADLRGSRLRAMVLFLLVVTLSTAAIVAGLESQDTAGEVWDDTFEEANGAHVTVSGPSEAIAGLADDERVAGTTQPYRLARDVNVELAGETIEEVGAMEMSADDRPEIARPLVRDGRWVEPGSVDEIVIDRALGQDRSIAVGDVIVLDGGAGPRELTVVGRAVDLTDCLYPYCTPLVWLDPAAFEHVAGEDMTSVMQVRLDDPEAVTEFSAEVFNQGFDTNDWIDTRGDALTLSEIFGAFLGVFGVFVMLAAAIVLAGSMATRAIARRRDIGLLKAVGVTPRQVTASIVASHAVTAALGVGLGWLVGSLLVTGVQARLQLGQTLGTGQPSFTAGRLVLVLVVVELIVLAATVLPAWRAGRVPTTVALAPVAARRTRRSWLAATARRLRVGPVGEMGVVHAFGRPARSLLTALALGTAVIAVIVTTGINTTIDNVFDNPALIGDPEEISVRTETDEATTTAVLDDTEGVSSWFTETSTDLILDDELFLGIALGGDIGDSGFTVREGGLPTGDGEAIVGYGLITRLGVGVGDELTVEVMGAELPLRIVGWYGESEDSGEVLRYRLDDLRTVVADARVERIAVNVSDGADRDAVVASLSHALPGAEVQAVQTEGTDEIDTFRLAFALVALLVLTVAFANLASTMLLVVRERSHDLGVLRAIGLKPTQTQAVVVIAATLIACVAVFVGIPVGWLAARAMSDAIGRVSGMGPGIGTDPAAWVLLLVVPATLGVAAALGSLAARRPSREQIAELVRYE